MITARYNQNPDVNSVIVDDDFDSDEKLPGRYKRGNVRSPEGDKRMKHPDTEEPIPMPRDRGPFFPDRNIARR